MMTFFEELRRRHVFRIGIAYLVVAWLLVQLANNVVAPLHLPDWTTTLIVVLLAFGFPVALVLAWAFQTTADAPESGDHEASRPGPTFGRKLDFVIIAVMALAIGYFASNHHSNPETQKAAGAVNTAEASIAVLPFQDFSPDHDQEYFADGLSEELLNQLAHLRGLRVIGRTSSFAFKGTNEDLRDIGEQLGVNHILEGSVRKAGNELRITAQLINPADGSHLWSQTYDRTLDDVFAVQEEISRTVASALSISIGALSLDEGGTRNFEAYDAYLSGHAQEYQSGGNNVVMGIADLERAVALDPAFIQAWASLYNLYRQAALTFGTEASEWRAKMTTAGDRLNVLAPDSPAANLVIADRAFFDGDFARAGTLLRAIGDLPLNLNQQGHLEECLFLFGMGRANDSVSCHKRMLQTDPLSVIASMNLQAGYEITGDLNGARAEYERAVAFASDPSFLVSVPFVWAMESGDPDVVRQAARSLPGPNEMVSLIDTPDAARRELRRRLDDPDSASDTVGLGVIALWAAYFDDPELALAALQESQRQPDLYSLWTMWRPIFKDVRRLPAFRQFVQDTGIADYWRASGNWGDFCHPISSVTGDEYDFECE